MNTGGSSSLCSLGSSLNPKGQRNPFSPKTIWRLGLNFLVVDMSWTSHMEPRPGTKNTENGSVRCASGICLC